TDKTDFHFVNSVPLCGLWTKNTSRALVERPYSCEPQAVGAVYDRPGFFVQSPSLWLKIRRRRRVIAVPVDELAVTMFQKSQEATVGFVKRTQLHRSPQAQQLI